MKLDESIVVAVSSAWGYKRLRTLTRKVDTAELFPKTPLAARYFEVPVHLRHKIERVRAIRITTLTPGMFACREPIPAQV